jgi:predicted phosphodiesterase
MQGLIAATRVSNREEALVLQVDHIEVYAGSVLVAARNNERGVPAIPLTSLMSAEMEFPGIESQARLPRMQERIVLECLVQLFLEHGICIEHSGLLIFPSLFKHTPDDGQGEFSRAISLYYDFSGAIDNIYAAVVSWLTLGGNFGALKLWENRADFGHPAGGTCGLRKIERPGGFAHLDVYFDETTTNETRELFISVVEEQLRQHGVEIYEHVEVRCACGFTFGEETIRKRIADGHNEIGCPECDRRIVISEGAKQARERDPSLQNRTWALRSETKKRKQEALERTKRQLSRAKRRLGASRRTLNILHLSDLHVRSESKIDDLLYPLIKDIRDHSSGLGISTLDYLVVSGDITDQATPHQFEKARNFVTALIKEFELNAERCIVVPGNHDLSWDIEVYRFLPTRLATRVQELPQSTYFSLSEGYLLRMDDAYPARFQNFSEHFYHPLFQKAYPMAPERQVECFHFLEDNLQFVTLNSAWEIDEYFPDRSSIHSEALAVGLSDADRLANRSVAKPNPFRIAVWHHPVRGSEAIQEDAFLGQLQKAGVRLALHGHVHEERFELVGYLDPSRELFVAGAGSLGARAKNRPESTPRLYNLLELRPDFASMKVHTRCRRREGGPWEGWAVWPSPNVGSKCSYYELKIA